MKVTRKERDAIADALPQLMFDTFGWTAKSEDDEDALEDLANHITLGIRVHVPSREEL